MTLSFMPKVYFDDGESVDLGDDAEETRRQMDQLEENGYQKYQFYLDSAQLNLEVKPASVRAVESAHTTNRTQGA